MSDERMSDRSGEDTSTSWSSFESEPTGFPTRESEEAQPVALSDDDCSSPPEELEMAFHPSSVTAGELENIREKYNIPSSISLRCPEEGEMPHRPPRGEVAFYLKMFSCGVRLPLHYFPQLFLSEACLAPAQLSPNGWNILLGCWVLWHLHGEGVELTSKTISALHYLKTLPGEKYMYYLATRRDPLVDGPSSIKNWKLRWFFVGGDWLSHVSEREYIHPIPRSFRVPVSNRERPSLPKSVKEVVRRILSIPIRDRCPSILLTEPRLLSSGLVCAPSMTPVTPLTPLDFINECRRQAEAASSSQQAFGIAYNPIGVQGGEKGTHRTRSRSPHVQASPTIATLASPSHRSQLPRAEFPGPYEHRDDVSMPEAEIDSICQYMREVILGDPDMVVNMNMNDLIRQQFKSAVMLSLAATRASREHQRLGEQLAKVEHDLQEVIGKKEEADFLNIRLEKDLEREKRISTRYMLKIKELQNKLKDDTELEKLFMRTKKFKSVESELFQIGAYYACECIRKKYPELDTSFIKKQVDRFHNEQTGDGVDDAIGCTDNVDVRIGSSAAATVVLDAETFNNKIKNEE